MTTMTLAHYMTRYPETIEATMTVDDARMTMLRLGVRHLPVMDGEQLIGVLSERDVAFAERIGAGATGLSELMDVDRLYAVDVGARLGEVVEFMAKNKVGSAAIFENRILAGIFTMVDACRALADALAPRRA